MKKWMKSLTKIRLINWHYFTDELIEVEGSVLIAGDNTSGKSTLLDAIKLVLTVNRQGFNLAANEKSKRNLKGYVRCKTGDDTNTYLRKGTVISYVALEFYEVKSNKSFIIGVKLDSDSEEGDIKSHWFLEEGQLENLSFVTDGRPSTTEQFRKNGRKIQTSTSVNETRQRFARRLGNLDDRFFEMIPKSLAFKPLDNVKEFINKFILAEKEVQIDALKQNIRTLKEYENLMKETKEKIKKLEVILDSFKNYEKKTADLQVNEVLIRKANYERVLSEMDAEKEELETVLQSLRHTIALQDEVTEQYRHEQNLFSELQITLRTSESSKLIQTMEFKLAQVESNLRSIREKRKKLDEEYKNVRVALKVLSEEQTIPVTQTQLASLVDADTPLEMNLSFAYNLEKFVKNERSRYEELSYIAKEKIKDLQKKLIILEAEIKSLENKRIPYPKNTEKLKYAIEEAFRKDHLDYSVYIFSELLEITDADWSNAIEGYLNTQRFYLLVDPQVFDVALRVYDQIKKEIHSVGLVNTSKLKLNDAVDQNSLAYLVTSESLHAKAYANYLLSRVNRVNTVEELKQYDIAMTESCMLYQNYAVRKIDDQVYRTPYIGARAIEIQLEQKKREREEISIELGVLNQQVRKLNSICTALQACSFRDMIENLDAPAQERKLQTELQKTKEQLEAAKRDPEIIELQMTINSSKKELTRLEKVKERLIKENTRLEERKNNAELKQRSLVVELNNKQDELEQLGKANYTIYQQGLEKFTEQRASKSSVEIINNFGPYEVRLKNERDRISQELFINQVEYSNTYMRDFGGGVDRIRLYQEEYQQLVSSEIIQYEEQLEVAKENCELEFRESFLAKLKEGIDDARLKIHELNKALRGITYGEDRYSFKISENEQKKHLYKMITSERNLGGTLLISVLDDEYKDEINDLFSKLTAAEHEGDKVVLEYTDYRNYLDYDIIVDRKDGSMQRFSKTYGEKSGGETQTPYYVSIAASFAQLYGQEDTIRIIMLDEAFDKMDDNRIEAMMDFFNSQQFQIICATPSSKMEIIGEKVDTILFTMREGSFVSVERHYL